MTWMLRLLTAALVLAVPAAPALAQERIGAAGGISIEKPEGWHLIPPDEATRNLDAYDFEDDSAKSKFDAPLITIMREEPQNARGVIPTIKISYVPYPAVRTRGPGGAIEDLLGGVRQALPDLKVIEPARNFTLAGRPAARLRVGFSLGSPDGQVQIEAEMIAIQRGNAGFFSIGFSYKAGDEATVRASLDAALASVRIDAK